MTRYRDEFIPQTTEENYFDTIENIIMGGDFNCPLNLAVDKRDGNLFLDNLECSIR